MIGPTLSHYRINAAIGAGGMVKVLDFGLAKAYAGESATHSGADLSQSPTLAHTGTQAGVLLGTAAYMSPEQARGKSVDKRADIWAFGVVLFEMLTGTPLFGGETVSDVLAAVLTREPDWSTPPASTPPAIRRLLRRCLQRTPRNRLHDVADARLVIDEVLSGRAGDEAAASTGPPAPQPVRKWRRALPWALLALAAAGGLVSFSSIGREAPGPATTVLPLDLGDDPIVMSFGASAVLSRAGRRLAWVGGTRSDSWIMLRDLDSAESRRLDGTGGAHDPVFSPDGEELAYFAGISLMKVPVRGGAPQRLAEVGLPRGATWSDDGFVVYNRDVADGLWRVAAKGGTPERLTAPDGHSLALQVYTGGRSDLWVFDLASGSRRRMTFSGRDEYPVWSPDGASLAFSRIEEGAGRSLARIRTDGVGEPVGFAASPNQRYPSSWSPGGELLITELSPETHTDIWVAWPGQPNRSPEPFLRTPANESHGLFSPDGRWVLYQSDESGAGEIYVRSFFGSPGRWQVSEGGGAQPMWSPDGRVVFYWSKAGLCRREVDLKGNAFVLGRLSVSAIEKPLLRTEDSGYVVARDGRVLLFPFAGKGGRRPRTVLILGWDREIERELRRHAGGKE